MKSLDVRCPVCNRPVSIIGKNKVARHNNYNTRAPGTKWSYLTCKGSGADATQLVADAKARAKVDEARQDLDRAEDHLRRARSDADKASAWASKCLDVVTRLRVKLAAMEAPETDANPVTHVATLEAT